MAKAARLCPFVSALLLSSCIPSQITATDLLQPPQVPPPGSVGEMFTPTPPPAKAPPLPAPPNPATPEAGSTGVKIDAGAAPTAGSNLLATMKPGDYERRKLKKSDEKDWGFMTSEFVWRAPERGYDTPFERGEWSTEDMVALPMVGPFYVFGLVEMGGDYAADQAMKVVGRTGLLWRLPVSDSSQIVVRGGPSVKYNDATKLDKVKDQGSMSWEVKATAPLVIGPVGLEYLGEAMPAVTPVDRNQVNSDLAFFLPVSGGKLKLGAKHQWQEGKQEARSTSGVMQWYLGIEIGR